MTTPNVVVFSSINVMEVYLVRSLLTREGIPSQIRGEFRAGLAGEVPMNDARPELLVPDAFEKRALEAITEATTKTGPDRICGQCGETSPHTFDTCWQCGGSLTEDDDGESL